MKYSTLHVPVSDGTGAEQARNAPGTRAEQTRNGTRSRRLKGPIDPDVDTTSCNRRVYFGD